MAAVVAESPKLAAAAVSDHGGHGEEENEDENVSAMLSLRLESTLSETAEYRRLAGSLGMQVASVLDELERMQAEAAAVGAKRDASRRMLNAARERRAVARASRATVEGMVEAERKRFSAGVLDQLNETEKERRLLEKEVSKIKAETDELCRANKSLRDQIEFNSRAKVRFGGGESSSEPHKAPSPVARRRRPQGLEKDEYPIPPKKAPLARPKCKKTTRDATIVLRVVDFGSSTTAPETFYRAKRSRPIKLLVDAHVTRKGVALDSVVFSYRGRVVDRYDKSPRQLGLPDLALLECAPKRQEKVGAGDEVKEAPPSFTECEPSTARRRVLLSRKDDDKAATTNNNSAFVGVVSSPNAVVLAVRDAVDSERKDAYYTIDQNDRFERLFLAHAKALERPVALLSFYTAGGSRQILEADTPNQLGLADLSQLLCRVSLS